MKRTFHNSSGTALVATLLATALFSTPLTAGSSCSSTRAAANTASADIVDTAVAAGSFNTLVAAVEAAGLVDALKADGPLTVFAPTDEAFAKLPPGTVESLLKPENKDRLIDILTYHVAPGSLTADRVVSMDRIKTLNGQRPRVEVRGNTVKLDNARITKTDIMTSNGVIHVIDEVILPQSMRAAAASPAEQVIRAAIERGVPMFNNNQPEACSAIYEVAAISLLSNDAFGISGHSQNRLRNALADADRMHDERRKAWILRHALDDVMEGMDEMPAIAAMNLR